MSLKILSHTPKQKTFARIVILWFYYNGTGTLLSFLCSLTQTLERERTLCNKKISKRTATLWLSIKSERLITSQTPNRFSCVYSLPATSLWSRVAAISNKSVCLDNGQKLRNPNFSGWVQFSPKKFFGYIFLIGGIWFRDNREMRQVLFRQNTCRREIRAGGKKNQSANTRVFFFFFGLCFLKWSSFSN